MLTSRMFTTESIAKEPTMTKTAKTRRRFVVLLAVIALMSVPTLILMSADASTQTLIFGTLQTSQSTAAQEAAGGVSVGMLELDWASYEPQQGVFDSSYVQSMETGLRQLQEAGMKVTLGLGLQNPPSWIFELPDSTYVDQNGNASFEANFVFNEAVRQQADLYLANVASQLGLSNFWAIRLTSGGDDEMLYPPGGSYWAFDQAALTGDGLPPTMTPNPFPSWRPGEAGLTPAQIDQWVDWYIGGLDDVTNWQMSTLSGLGFSGYYELVTPGSGTRPDVLAQEEQENLPDGTTGVGAVWDRYYAGLSDKTNVMAYVSSVADGSGGDDSCTTGDDSLALDSPTMDSWSTTRWISRIADQNGLLKGGENPGLGSSTALDAQYTNTSSTGMMADAIRQAVSCGFRVFYWAHDEDLWDGTLPFSFYASSIAAEQASAAPTTAPPTTAPPTTAPPTTAPPTTAPPTTAPPTTAPPTTAPPTTAPPTTAPPTTAPPTTAPPTTAPPTTAPPTTAPPTTAPPTTAPPTTAPPTTAPPTTAPPTTAGPWTETRAGSEVSFRRNGTTRQ